MNHENTIRLSSSDSLSSATNTRSQFSSESAPSGDVTEEVLLCRARRGDVSSFESLVHLHRQHMHRAALRVTEHHEDAEEAVQESVWSAYQKLNQFHGDAQLRTWLTRITINHALMILRKRKTGRVIPLAFEAEDGETFFDPADLRPNPEQHCYRREMSGKLQTALERLSPALRAAFELRHVDELTSSEAARALGISVPAFKSRLMRARQTLQRRRSYAFDPASERCKSR